MWPQQTLASVKAASEDHFILSLAFLTFLHFHSLSRWAWHYFYFDTPMPSYALEAPEFRDMLAVLKWSCTAINRFWRTIYGSWIWLPQDVATQVVSDGWAFLESWNTDLEHTDFKIAQADDKCVQMFKWQIWTWKVWTWGDHTFFTMVLNILTFFSGSQILTIRMDTLHWHHSQPKLGFLDTRSALSCTWWHTCCFSTSSNILFVGLALVRPKHVETKMVVLFGCDAIWGWTCKPS